MSIPLKHHYLPAFYLARWSLASTGLVYAYQRPHKSVVVKGYHPAAVGFRPQLYTIESRTDLAGRQAVESGFMSPLDDVAARALAYIDEHNQAPEDAVLRSAWSRFILSLLFRSPERITWLREALRSRAAQSAKLKIYPVAPSSPEDWRNSGSVPEVQAQLLCRLIDNPRVGEHLNNMRWVIGEFGSARHGLLTSDNPVITSNGLGGAEGFVLLPISTAKFFLAANTEAVIRSFVDQPSTALELALNDAVVRQAEGLVIGHTCGHLRFVQNRWGMGSALKQGQLQRAFWRAPV